MLHLSEAISLIVKVSLCVGMRATEKAVSVKLGVYDGFSQICKIKGNRRIVRDHQICLGKNVLVGIRRIHKFYPWIMTEHMQTVNDIWVRHEADGISVFLCRSQKSFVVEKIIIKMEIFAFLKFFSKLPYPSGIGS